MNKILVLAESLNKDKSSEGIATVNFLNAIDTEQFDVWCVFYEFPQFEIEKLDWINPKIRLIHIKNNRVDAFLSKYNKLKNFFSSLFGISILKEYRVFRFRKKLNTQFADFKFDLIFSRTVATSICSHRALVGSKLNQANRTLIYFNDPVPFSLMPPPYSNGVSYNPRFDRKEISHVKEIISKASMISSPSKLLNDFFINLHGDVSKATFTFPHLYLGDGASLTMDCSSYFDPEKINITHCGSLLTGRDPSNLIFGIAEFLDHNPEFKGKISVNFFGPLHHGHARFFESTGFDFIHVVNKRITHGESLALMYQADLPVLIEASAEESPFMPVKLAEMIGLGRIFLVLSPTKSETRRILGKKYKFQTEAFNKSEIISIVSDFINKKYDQEVEEKHIKDLQEYISPKTVNSSLQQIIDKFNCALS